MQIILKFLKSHFYLFLPFVFIPSIANSNSLLAIIALILFFLLNPNIKIQNPLNNKFATILLCLLFFISVHSFVFTDYTFINYIGSNARNYGVFFYSILFLLFLHFLTFSNLKFKRIILINLVIANILGLIGLLQFAIPDLYGYLTRINFFDAKIFASFLLPNFFGQYLSLSINLGVYNKLKNHTKSLFIFVLPILAMIFSRSKIAILATILTLILYFYERNRHHLQAKFLAILGLPLLTFLTFSDTFHLNRSLISRIELFKSSFNIFLDNLLGINFYGLENLFPKYVSFQHYFIEQNLEIIYDKAHNFLLDYFLVFGLVGILFLLPICLQIFHKIKTDFSKLILILPVLTIASFSIFSVPSYILITLLLAILFVEKNQIYIESKKYITLYLVIILFIFTGHFYGQMQYQKFQDTHQLSYLQTSLIYNPTNLAANLDIFQYIELESLENFHRQSLAYFSNQNLSLKRAYIKAQVLNDKDMEIQIQGLINENPNDFKNHLLLANYYYFKKDFKKANQTFNNLKKHIDLSQIQDFKGSHKYLQAFQKFE